MAANAIRKAKQASNASVAEVATLWSETILDVKQLGSGKGEQERFDIGDDPTCDSWLEPVLIGEESKFALVATEGSEVVLRIPAGADVTLERPGMTITGLAALLDTGLTRADGSQPGVHVLPMETSWVATVTLGDLAFRVRRTSAGRLEHGVTPVDWNAINWTGASLLVHAVFLALVFAIPPEPSSIAIDGANTGNRFASYLVAPPEIETPELPDFRPEQEVVSENHIERGAAHQGTAGQMGDRTSPDTDRHYAVRDRGREQFQLGREERIDHIINNGIISALRANVPTSPFGADVPNGMDAEDALGALMGVGPGTSFGYDGLGIAGTGRGGGNRNGSISLGTLNTFGRMGTRNLHDNGRNRARLTDRGHRTTGPTVRVGSATVSGSLARDVIRRRIRLHRAEVAHCYQRELTARPDLAGRISIRFIIDQNGNVISSGVSSSSVESTSVGQCVAGVMRRITFPSPGDGVVVVNYPFTFVSHQ